MLKYLGILIMKTTILFILILAVMGCAQYSANISGYHLYVYDIQDPVATENNVDIDSVVLGLTWERGALDPFIVPGTWTEYYKGWISNTPEMWDGGSASGSQTISFVEGYYAVTMTEVDIYQNESPKAIPFYLHCRQIYAKIPINLFYRE